MLTVGDLREQIADLPDSLIIVLAKDAEGNDYSPLGCMGTNRYRPHNSWSGNVSKHPHKDSVPALVLEPIN